MKSVVKFANKGGLVFGICNGFQVLVESELLPGALITNNKVKFLSKEVILKVEATSSPFTSDLKIGDLLRMPIAHKQGNYIVSDDILKQLEDQDRIAFRYKGNNPNGSISNIAGILNSQKNILGMMPHPERAAENILGSSDGKYIFESILK